MRTAVAADEPEPERPVRIYMAGTTATGAVSWNVPMATLWRCPCGLWLAPHVREHRCA